MMRERERVETITKRYEIEAKTIVRYRPKKESARNAPKRVRSMEVPDQTLTISAAATTEMRSGPVR